MHVPQSPSCWQLPGLWRRAKWTRRRYLARGTCWPTIDLSRLTAEQPADADIWLLGGPSRRARTRRSSPSAAIRAIPRSRPASARVGAVVHRRGRRLGVRPERDARLDRCRRVLQRHGFWHAAFGRLELQRPARPAREPAVAGRLQLQRDSRRLRLADVLFRRRRSRASTATRPPTCCCSTLSGTSSRRPSTASARGWIPTSAPAWASRSTRSPTRPSFPTATRPANTPRSSATRRPASPPALPWARTFGSRPNLAMEFSFATLYVGDFQTDDFRLNGAACSRSAATTSTTTGSARPARPDLVPAAGILPAVAIASRLVPDQWRLVSSVCSPWMSAVCSMLIVFAALPADSACATRRGRRWASRRGRRRRRPGPRQIRGPWQTARPAFWPDP